MDVLDRSDSRKHRHIEKSCFSRIYSDQPNLESEYRESYI